MQKVWSSSTRNPRAFLGVVCLFAVTVLAMTVVWYWPDHPVLHFWLVAQALPVCYVILAWWGSQALTKGRDAL